MIARITKLWIDADLVTYAPTSANIVVAIINKFRFISYFLKMCRTAPTIPTPKTIKSRIIACVSGL
jgi:hypothetical protein